MDCQMPCLTLVHPCIFIKFKFIFLCTISLRNDTVQSGNQFITAVLCRFDIFLFGIGCVPDYHFHFHPGFPAFADQFRQFFSICLFAAGYGGCCNNTFLTHCYVCFVTKERTVCCLMACLCVCISWSFDMFKVIVYRFFQQIQLLPYFRIAAQTILFFDGRNQGMAVCQFFLQRIFCIFIRELLFHCSVYFINCMPQFLWLF